MKKTHCLTGKDLKAYRESRKYSQRMFAHVFDIKRGTLANYEWSGKDLPSWIISKMLRFDPRFEITCIMIRENDKHLTYHYETPFKKKNWLERFIGWLIGY